jgi:hypothetical protein
LERTGSEMVNQLNSLSTQIAFLFSLFQLSNRSTRILVSTSFFIMSESEKSSQFRIGTEIS